MSLKQLIKEAERLKTASVDKNACIRYEAKLQLHSIKQTVEAVDCGLDYTIAYSLDEKWQKEWQKLKKLLGVK